MSRTRSTTALLAVVLTAGLTGTALAAPAPPRDAAPAAPPLGFSHTVVVDPQRLGGEPIIKADPDGGLYGSSIIGFSNGVSFLWKSEDKGAQWDLINALPSAVPAQRPDDSYGGGDSEIAISPFKRPGDPGYTVSFYDLESLADISTSTSHNSGSSFGTANNLSSTVAGTDRQWSTYYRDPQGKDHLYLIFNGQSQSPNTVLLESLDYGATFHTLGAETPTAGVFDSGALGQLRADPANGDLFFTSENSPDVNLVRSTDGGLTFTKTLVHHANGSTRQLFITSALDSAGNVYVVWSEVKGGTGADKTDVTQYAAVSTDHGASFGPPVRMSPPGVHQANFSWIVAGDPGRIDTVFYGTTNPGDTSSNSGPWNVYLSQSLDFLNPDGTPNATPSVATTQVSEHPNHVNPICLGGLGCTAGSAQDRNLSDFFQVDKDPQGAAIVIWNDTANEYGTLAGSPVNSFARQLSGPSLFAAQGTVAPGPAELALGQTGNQAVDPTGDALSPAHGASGPGTNIDSLDLQQVSVTDAGSNVVIKAKVKSGAVLGAINPANGPSASYVVSWWAGVPNGAGTASQVNNGKLGDVRFVGMQTHGAAGDSVFYSGEPTYTNNSSGMSRFAEFVPGPNAPVAPTGLGSFDAATGTITWTLSKAAAGLTAGSPQLFSVTGTTLQGDGVYAPNTGEKQVDATPPFTYGAAPAVVTPALPETPAVWALPLVGIALLGAVAVRRRRRTA